MTKLARVCGTVFIIWLLLVVNAGSVAAQQGVTSQYFPDTGHNVSGDFWTYYQSVPNASFVFGSPITEQFSDTVSGRVIQYFQRARFEYYPENPEGQRVRLAALGDLVYARATPEGTLNIFTPIGCRYYPETAVSLCYAFLEFFDKNGGEAIFGKPTSPFAFYNGRIVQYFERARFEWYPEYPEDQKVVLAEVGRIAFDLVPEDANRLQPVRAENIPGQVQTISIRAFTWKAVTQLTDSQVIYVVVQDQTYAPVVGATAVVSITWPVGGTQSVAVNTNANGIVMVPIQVQGQPHGSVVLINVEVLYSGISNRTTTSFRVWQ